MSASSHDAVLHEVAQLAGATPVHPAATWSELGLDSLDLFVLLTAVEQATGAVVTDAQAARLHRVQDLLDCVADQLSG